MTLFLQSAVAASLLGTVLSTLSIYPHQLAYFNELAGGLRGGHKHLLGSNLDWGQDFLFLKDYQRTHLSDGEPLLFSDSAMYDPRDLGVQCNGPMNPYVASETELPHGLYAVSAGLLFGDPKSAPSWQHELFTNRKPACLVGASIYIFHIPGHE